MECLKRALRNSSTVVWAVNLNHLLWGWYFLTQEIPQPFGAIFAFNDPHLQQFWGVTFILVAFISILSDLMKNGLLATILLVPQQLVVMYGFMEMLKAVLNGVSLDGRLILALGWVGPLAFMHTVSVITRYTRSHHAELSDKIDQLLEEKL